MNIIYRSESTKELSKALLKFHKEMGVVMKDEENPFFKSKFASLPTILKEIKEPLQKAGLVIMQFPSGENGLITQITHADSGEYMNCHYVMAPSKSGPQGVGSAITYQRRYALGAILSLNIDEDDDGNKASATTAKSKKSAAEVAEDIIQM